MECANPVQHRPTPHQLDHHHVVPKSYGGAEGRLVVLCVGCHHAVHSLLDDWIRAGAGDTPNPALARRYSHAVRSLAAEAWAARPVKPPFTLAEPWAA